MYFKDFKEIQVRNHNIFYHNELVNKNFFILCFNEFLKYKEASLWQLDIDDPSLNSTPNFTQKHPLCISSIKHQDNIFQFRICCENNTNSFGYRLFIKFDDAHKDFLTNNSLSDDIAMKLKTKHLKEFECISLCGWWITDIWRDLFKINDDTNSTNFIKNIIDHELTKQMLRINDKLLEKQKSNLLNDLINSIKI